MNNRPLNRLNDFFFKNLMGNEKRSDLTLRFLNLILDRTKENEFKKIRFLNPFFDPLTIDGKLAILDIRASIDDNSFVDIELQVARQNYMPKRSMYYLSRMYSEQMVRGEQYNELKPVVDINLLGFQLFKNEPDWHNKASFTLEKSKKIITDCITLHFLELPKLKISDIKKVKRLEAWGAYFSGKCTEKEMEVLTMSEPLLKKALSYEKTFVNDEEMYYKYQLREDAIREEKTKLSLAEERGIKKGIKQGVQQEKIQNAINLLRIGLSPETVSKGIHLDIEKVKELQKNLY